ncbi:MAG: hypothetical protein ACP5R2_02415 [Anaerolineae bacterium]
MDTDGYIWTDGAVQPSSGFEEAFYRRKAIVEGTATLTLPLGMPPGVYVLKMGYQDEISGEIIGEFNLPAEHDDVTVTLPDTFPPAEAVQPPHVAHLIVEDELRLLGYAPSAEQVLPGQVIWLTLYWRALRGVHRDYVIGIQLVDAAGKEVAYWLGRPVMSRYPTNQWHARQVVQDPWRLQLPLGISAGRYSLNVAMYDAQTGKVIERASLTELTVR